MELLFVHGSGGMRENWYHQMAAFPEGEFIDLPGHPVGRPCGSVEGYTEWLRGFIAGRGYAEVALVGWSLGGAIAMNYALEHPQDLRGIVLIATGARLRVEPAHLQRLREALHDLSRWDRDLEFAWLPQSERQRAREKQLAIGPAVHLNDLLCCDRFDLMDRVQEIRLPALVMCGTADEMTPPKYTCYLAEKIPGARSVIFEGATHALPREKPQVVNGAITDFLQGLS